MRSQRGAPRDPDCVQANRNMKNRTCSSPVQVIPEEGAGVAWEDVDGDAAQGEGARPTPDWAQLQADVNGKSADLV